MSVGDIASGLVVKVESASLRLCLYFVLKNSKNDERRYVISANEDVEMLDVEDEADEEGEVESELDPDEGTQTVSQIWQN